MHKLKRLYSLYKKRKGLRQLLNAFEYDYLYETGWTESAIRGYPVDKDGNPIPWISIPTIEILKEKKLNNLFVFEYGSGNSTIWFSKRVKRIVSIEHDKEWYEYQLKQPKLANTEVFYKELNYNGDYSKEVQKYKNIDIVLIDGRDRVNCAINSVNSLSSKGVIIIDDSQRKNYKEAIIFLKNSGFKELKLVGMNVGRAIKKTTSIFYKINNCLDI